ncbi:MAG: hypothetical protein COW89_08600 [Nitrospinae bacterium CG22_combo_CG10-13_8_21_14_all_47_10]|nr:MAG: hypothetical protein COW89_08600 [Nitrospinae bacterium CG22_combo_CG10-13_8_21_14_all_47_10]
MDMIDKSFSVFIVDDDEEDIFLTKTALRKISKNVKVETFGNGQKLVDFLFKKNSRNQYDLPDLILLDLMIPVKNGIETLKELKASLPISEIPVLVHTRQCDMSEIEEAIKYGAFSVTPKFSELQLKVQIYNALDHCFLAGKV